MASPSPLPHVGDVAVEDETPLLLVDSPSQAVVDLRPKILKQVEYYFSDENLPNDKFLLKHINKDKSGFVSIEVIASFRRMQKLTKDIALILDALKESSLLVVSPNKKKVGRLHPLPLTEFKDPNPKLCTVLVENLPEDQSKEDIQRIFGQVGSIKSICICGSHAAADFKQNSKAEKLISGKLHTLVEYETVEAAEKAALTLNDEKDWRNGLRVQLLQKRMAYNNLGRKAWRGSDAGKGSHTLPDHVADEDNANIKESHEDTHEVQDGYNLPKEKDGRRGQNRRSKGHKQRGNSGLGHGNVTTAHIEAAKAPPGPRMPDGTRGFTMGRGCPPASTQF